jgi:hypothetical protein
LNDEIAVAEGAHAIRIGRREDRHRARADGRGEMGQARIRSHIQRRALEHRGGGSKRAGQFQLVNSGRRRRLRTGLKNLRRDALFVRPLQQSDPILRMLPQGRLQQFCILR